MKPFNFFLLLLVLTNQSLKAATCTASNGAWTSASTWSCGRIPIAGDVAVIPSGVTVTVSQNQSTTANTLQISGTLSFSNGAKLTLPNTGTVTIFSGGQVSGGNGGSVLSIGSTDIYTGGAAPLSGPTTCTVAGCGALPVTLVTFKATNLNNNSALISWETINENNSHFFVLKRGKYLNDFSKIAQIEAHGQSNTKQYYSFVDESLSAGIYYYQLEQTDHDGLTQYFRPLSIVIEDTDYPFHVFPNPVKEQTFRVKIDGIENNIISLNSINGQSIIIETQKESENVFIVTPKQVLASGIYFLHVRNNTYEKSYKIIVP
ncbi:MAG: T9SS type A sorting domain-containing protein [Arcicella sp.]|jgi:hypothetical protein|nr:T9SS type A sorting domain-containing protein [Arcicella sp.]